jgi:hypothetical protein
LLTCPTIAQAAKAAGVSEATAGRWLKDSAFQGAYREVRRQALDRAIVMLEQGMLGAVAVLRTVMTAPDTPAATKVRAALGILETGLRAYELGEIEERIRALEAQQGRGQ